MDFYIDFEFLEGTQKNGFPLNLFIKETNPTIDLISIGVISGNGKTFYAVSKDFNIKEAWNRHQVVELVDHESYYMIEEGKQYWIRENVLKPIFEQWKKEENDKTYNINDPSSIKNTLKFTYKNFKYCIKEIGKTKEEIYHDLLKFINLTNLDVPNSSEYTNPRFIGYYSDYDWVIFCWIFGKMNYLPSNFPQYCYDLKQELDRKVESLDWYLNKHILSDNDSIYTIGVGENHEKDCKANFNAKLARIKELKEYPKQVNEHNALSDAIWSKQLHEFIKLL